MIPDVRLANDRVEPLTGAVVQEPVLVGMRPGAEVTGPAQDTVALRLERRVARRRDVSVRTGTIDLRRVEILQDDAIVSRRAERVTIGAVSIGQDNEVHLPTRAVREALRWTRGCGSTPGW